MPIKKNAKKALRQAIKRTIRNKKVKDAYKKAVKEAKKTTDNKDLKEALRLAQKRLDKAAKSGVIKKKTASRKLSRLMKQMAKTVKK